MLSFLVAFTLNGLPATEPSEIYQDEQLQLSLISENTSLHPQDENWLGLYIEMVEGWHIYWQNPGDNGVPPTLSLQLSEAATIGEIHWPQPERFYLDDFVDYGYRSTLLMFSVSVNGGDNLIDINGHITWLACKDICLPGQADLRLTLPVAADSGKAFLAPLFDEARKNIPRLTEGVFASYRRDGDKLLVVINGLPAIKTSWEVFPKTSGIMKNTRDIFHSNSNGQLSMDFKLAEIDVNLPESFEIVLTAVGQSPILIQVDAK